MRHGVAQPAAAHLLRPAPEEGVLAQDRRDVGDDTEMVRVLVLCTEYQLPLNESVAEMHAPRESSLVV